MADQNRTDKNTDRNKEKTGGGAKYLLAASLPLLIGGRARYRLGHGGV